MPEGAPRRGRVGAQQPTPRGVAEAAPAGKRVAERRPRGHHYQQVPPRRDQRGHCGRRGGPQRDREGLDSDDLHRHVERPDPFLRARSIGRPRGTRRACRGSGDEQWRRQSGRCSNAVVAKPAAPTNSASPPSPHPTTTARRSAGSPRRGSQSASCGAGAVRFHGTVVSPRSPAAYSSSNHAVGRPQATARAARTALSASQSRGEVGISYTLPCHRRNPSDWLAGGRSHSCNSRRASAPRRVSSGSLVAQVARARGGRTPAPFLARGSR